KPASSTNTNSKVDTQYPVARSCSSRVGTREKAGGSGSLAKGEAAGARGGFLAGICGAGGGLGAGLRAGGGAAGGEAAGLGTGRVTGTWRAASGSGFAGARSS